MIIKCKTGLDKFQPLCMVHISGGSWLDKFMLPHCCDHSDGIEFVNTLFYLHCLVKGVFSPVPPYCGYFAPSNLSLPCQNCQNIAE